MKYILLTLFLFVTPALAQTKSVVEDCELSITKAELGTDETAYTRCGFDDENLAFSKWSGFVSQKQMKKGMYELCMRHPNHEYGPIYCQKSADLGYGPALAELGHKAMADGVSESALRYYTRALASKQLNEDQEGKVAEQLGVYYLQPGDHYAPAKGVAFMSAAAKKRSALANNAMGYFSYTGQLGVKQDPKEAFTYFWRAILLGCPAAEENVGVFHLARNQKITPETASAYMKQKALTCDPTSVRQTAGGTVTAKPAGCDCNEVMNETARAGEKPYYLTDITGKSAKLKDKQGALVSVQAGQTLASGYTVAEVRKTVVILTKGVERIILNVLPSDSCVSYCQAQTGAGMAPDVQIKPYRITFTPNECQDIMYYAKALVDTSKPFVGKEQCASDTTLVQDPLLDMLGAGTAVSDVSEAPDAGAQAPRAVQKKASAPTVHETPAEAPKKSSAARTIAPTAEQQRQKQPPKKKGPRFYQFTVGADATKGEE